MTPSQKVVSSCSTGVPEVTLPVQVTGVALDPRRQQLMNETLSVLVNEELARPDSNFTNTEVGQRRKR